MHPDGLRHEPARTHRANMAADDQCVDSKREYVAD
jgi:hypothetical protein